MNKFSKKIGLESLSISCILLILLFSFSALAEDISVPDSVGTDEKISSTLSSKIAETSATERIPVIILLNNQNIQFNTAKGISQIDNEQKNLMNLLSDAESIKKHKM